MPNVSANQCIIRQILRKKKNSFNWEWNYQLAVLTPVEFTWEGFTANPKTRVLQSSKRHTLIHAQHVCGHNFSKTCCIMYISMKNCMLENIYMILTSKLVTSPDPERQTGNPATSK
jgi:hypothetical protein